jgi:hypothetical protein
MSSTSRSSAVPPATPGDLYTRLLALCQAFGTTTEHTYELLDAVVESLIPDTTVAPGATSISALAVPPLRLVITLDGGLVDRVYTSGSTEAIDICIADHDIDGVDEDQTSRLPATGPLDRETDVYLHAATIESHVAFVAAVFAVRDAE